MYEHKRQLYIIGTIQFHSSYIILELYENDHSFQFSNAISCESYNVDNSFLSKMTLTMFFEILELGSMQTFQEKHWSFGESRRYIVNLVDMAFLNFKRRLTI